MEHAIRSANGFHAAEPRAAKRHSDWLMSVLLSAVVLLLFAIDQELHGSDRLMHWFLVPVALCGIVIGADAVRWLRGELDVFDPIGIVGLFGIHFFLLAPLLHLSWEYWIEEVVPPSDWRTWLGGMAALNFAGLLVYRAVRARVCGGPSCWGKAAVVWQLEPTRFRRYLAVALLVSGVLQLWVYSRFGGVWGYIAAVERQEHVFLGSERIAMIAESFPILAMMGYAVFTWGRRKPSWLAILAVLVAFCVLKMLFGGLQGSRNNILFAVFWGVGIVHFGIRPVSRKLMVWGILALVPFLYFYGFYKSAGVEGFQRALQSSRARADEAADINRPIQSTILGDLGRSDVQAFVLYRTAQPGGDYRYALGRTYVGAVLAILPGPIWRNRPPAKVKEGTEVLYGRGTYREGALTSVHTKDKYDGRTSRVFGIAGEAMLNFGPLGVLLAMGILGLVVGCVRRWMLTWDPGDVRRLLLPFLVNSCVMLLILDLENVITMLEEDFLLPFVVLAAASARRAGCVPSSNSLRQASGNVLGKARLEECP